MAHRQGYPPKCSAASVGRERRAMPTPPLTNVTTMQRRWEKPPPTISSHAVDHQLARATEETGNASPYCKSRPPVVVDEQRSTTAAPLTSFAARESRKTTPLLQRKKGERRDRTRRSRRHPLCRTPRLLLAERNMAHRQGYPPKCSAASVGRERRAMPTPPLTNVTTMQRRWEKPPPTISSHAVDHQLARATEETGNASPYCKSRPPVVVDEQRSTTAAPLTSFAARESRKTTPLLQRKKGERRDRTRRSRRHPLCLTFETEQQWRWKLACATGGCNSNRKGSGDINATRWVRVFPAGSTFSFQRREACSSDTFRSGSGVPLPCSPTVQGSGVGWRHSLCRAAIANCAGESSGRAQRSFPLREATAAQRVSSVILLLRRAATTSTEHMVGGNEEQPATTMVNSSSDILHPVSSSSKQSRAVSLEGSGGGFPLSRRRPAGNDSLGRIATV
nr:hypothetical protein Itr_chr06CG13060 [Ipomoea trifida]